MQNLMRLIDMTETCQIGSYWHQHLGVITKFPTPTSTWSIFWFLWEIQEVEQGDKGDRRRRIQKNKQIQCKIQYCWLLWWIHATTGSYWHQHPWVVTKCPAPRYTHFILLHFSVGEGDLRRKIHENISKFNVESVDFMMETCHNRFILPPACVFFGFSGR